MMVAWTDWWRWRCGRHLHSWYSLQLCLDRTWLQIWEKGWIQERLQSFWLEPLELLSYNYSGLKSLREEQIEAEIYDFDLRMYWVSEAYQTSKWWWEEGNRIYKFGYGEFGWPVHYKFGINFWIMSIFMN